MSLSPTRFHRELREYLREREPGLFSWYASGSQESERVERLQLELLRATYRLSAETHERPHRLARLAGERLGIDVPIHLYQAQSSRGANAALFFAKDIAHVVLDGPLVASLDDDELLALFGHELAHHRFFTIEDGSFHVASEVVEASAEKAAVGAFAASAIRHRRWTEILADRGALLACGALEPAIACLVKVSTGLANVSARDYLAQSHEIVAKLASLGTSEDGTHPETAVRAVALELWHTEGDAAEDRISALVDGTIALETLDLVQQARVADATRTLVERILQPSFMQTEANRAHARAYFPTAGDVRRSPTIEVRSPSLDEYFAYVLLDFVVVDKDLGDVPLAHAGLVASELGFAETFSALARRELKMTAAAFAALEKKAHALVAEAERSSTTSARDVP